LRPAFRGRTGVRECFYALDVGRGFATSAGSSRGPGSKRFYALDVGRGFATCVLRRQCD